MVLSGKVNPDLVMEINKFGDKAIGLSGRSAGIIKGKILDQEKYGRVGTVQKIDSEIIMKVLYENLIPVIAPIGFDSDNKSLNINADFAAAAIAAEIKADVFVFVTDVDGLYENFGKENQMLIESITIDKIENGISSGEFEGGMIPKLDSCLKAVKNGCDSAIICNAKTENVLINWMNNDNALGTLVTK